MEVHISSDLTEPWEGTIKWTLETLSGEMVDSGSLDFEGSSLSDTLIHSFDFKDLVNTENERDLVFVCELWQMNKHISTSVGTFVPNKHVSFADPGLKVTIGQGGNEFIFNLTANQWPVSSNLS